MNTKEIEGVRSVWSPETSDIYLQSLGRGEEFLLPFVEYPQELRVKPELSQLFGIMRERSLESLKEWYAVIGVAVTNRHVVLQTDPSMGGALEVKLSVSKKQKERLLTLTNAQVKIGDIHSHPVNYVDENGHSIWAEEIPAAFSGSDLQNLIGLKHTLLIGLVGGQETVLAFRSRETKLTDSCSYIGLRRITSDFLTKYWTRKHGLKYDSKSGMIMAKKVDDLWEINLDIADHHKLVLYRTYDDFIFKRVNRPR